MVKLRGMVQSLLLTLLASLMLLLGMTNPVFAVPQYDYDRGSDVTRASDTTYKGRQVLQQNPQKGSPEIINGGQNPVEKLGKQVDRAVNATKVKTRSSEESPIQEAIDGVKEQFENAKKSLD